MKVSDVIAKIDRLEIMAGDLKNNVSFITERTTVSDVIDVFLDYREMLENLKVEK